MTRRWNIPWGRPRPCRVDALRVVAVDGDGAAGQTGAGETGGSTSKASMSGAGDAASRSGRRRRWRWRRRRVARPARWLSRRAAPHCGQSVRLRFHDDGRPSGPQFFCPARQRQAAAARRRPTGPLATAAGAPPGRAPRRLARLYSPADPPSDCPPRRQNDPPRPVERALERLGAPAPAFFEPAFFAPAFLAPDFFAPASCRGIRAAASGAAACVA